jgi:hypothetical protein
MMYWLFIPVYVALVAGIVGLIALVGTAVLTSLLAMLFGMGFLALGQSASPIVFIAFTLLGAASAIESVTS